MPRLMATKNIKAFSLSVDSEAIEGPGQNPTMPAWLEALWRTSIHV